MTVDELRRDVGAPDVVTEHDTGYITAMYGDIELLFDHERRVDCIEFHDFSQIHPNRRRPHGRPSIRLDPWVVRCGLTITAFVRALDAAGIPCQAHSEWPRRPIDLYATVVMHSGKRRLTATFIQHDDAAGEPVFDGLWHS